jgi:hypothetical protein
MVEIEKGCNCRTSVHHKAVEWCLNWADSKRRWKNLTLWLNWWISHSMLRSLMEKRVLSEELAQLTVSYIYSLSSQWCQTKEKSPRVRSARMNYSACCYACIARNTHLPLSELFVLTGGGSLQAFTFTCAVYENRGAPTYYVTNSKFS